ncbi:tape measure protein [Serratia marcescens]|uniref:tape measure protein n=1 Tax=Serratia marcescens TaxID=615 RepID=UPI00217AAB9F|nr:tape measure protein [Serratia marcescens]CAI2029266.1 tape measure domain [Serratia marcescens]CAI2157353.1 tape measure domain [Serratia marcescens]
MSSSNVVVTSTVNKVSFSVDQGSYQKAKKQIQSIGKEWDKTAAKMKPLAAKVNPQGSERFKQSEYTRRTKAARAEAAAAKQAAREQLQAERKIQQIRAKSIRFSTAASSYNLTGKQRTESLSQFGDLTRKFHAGQLAVSEYNAAVSKLQSSMRQQGKVGMRGSTLPVTAKVTKLDTSMIEGAKGAITIAATVAVGKSIMTAGQDLQSMESGLTAVTGSADKAAKEMQYLRDQSNRLGLDLIKTGKDYTSFYAAAKSSMSDGQIRNLFEGVSEYATVLGASADEQSRALKALNQMASKGQIMSEELKGQLAEGIPGAVDVFVKALQKTQNNVNLTTKDLFKMMEEGKLMSKDILPAVADEFKALARNGGALDKAVNSNRASFQRLKTAMQASMGEFFDGGFGSALTNAFDTISAALNNNADTFKFWGDLAGNVIDGATDAFAHLYDTVVLVSSIIGDYLEDMGVSFESMKGWGDMAAYAAGVILFAGSVWKLGGALKWVISFLNPLTKLLGVMQGIAALGGIEAATSGGVSGKQPKGTPTKQPGKVGKWGKGALAAGGGMVGAAAMNPYTYPALLGGYAVVSTDNATREADGLGILDSIAQRWKAGGWANNAQNKAAEAALRPTIDMNSVYAGNAFMNTYRNPVEAATQKHQIEVTSVVKVQDGAVKGLVREEIEDFDGRQINMMIGGGH